MDEANMAGVEVRGRGRSCKWASSLRWGAVRVHMTNGPGDVVPCPWLSMVVHWRRTQLRVPQQIERRRHHADYERTLPPPAPETPSRPSQMTSCRATLSGQSWQPSPG
jgi:hypothetical protein